MNKINRFVCALTCVALMTGAVGASAVEATPVPEASVQQVYSYSNTEYRGPLTFESHFQSRGGYPVAYYSIYLYAPSDVVGIRINDMDIMTGNSVKLSGSVGKDTVNSAFFEKVTFKIALYYDDKAPYITYETIDVQNYRCGMGNHMNPEHCTL